jgi:hypothetical protein
MTLDELDAGARVLVQTLEQQDWDSWRDALVSAMWQRDAAEQAEAVGETLLLVRDGLHFLRPHRERDDALKRLAISSAVHWPHRA